MNTSFFTLPTSLRRAARTLGVAAVGALTIGLTARAATAQPVRAGAPPAPAQLENLDGSRVPRATRGFSLYGLGDLAVGGLRYSGVLTMGLTNYAGPCSDAQALTGCGYINRNGSVGQRIFEIGFIAGAPISEFRKIRSVYPGVNAAQSPAGYTAIYNSDLLGVPRKWGPADNHIGRLNSGVTTVADNSCQDQAGFAGGYIDYGLTLLALSNCPQTWPASGFDGVRPVADTTYQRIFSAAPDSFRFDYWRVPRAERDNSQFLGNFSTYGESSDHYSEVLGLYGGVTPRGTGAPAIGGYPLGLTARFDAFTFSRPELASAVYYQVTVINNSADVYGRGIDYDSLYMGLTPGFVGGNTAVYYVPEQNALKAVNVGVNPGCNGGSPAPGIACSNGFNSNAFGIVMLKSPIGDTRNKLLSKPGPFFNPTSPFADDTITFNHGHLCEFSTPCQSTTLGSTQRAGFGIISSTEANTLDGRDPASLASNTLWYTFRNRAYVLNQVQPAFARFNRFVPTGTTNPRTGQPFGNWDYNNDGVADTLFLDSCAEAGCVTAFADTAPGKQIGPGRSQVGGQFNAGPFRLRAGDTTSFIYAFVGATDSLGFENTTRNAIDAYMTFFLSPNPPPTPRITGVEVRTAEAAEAASGTGGLLDPFVRLRLSNEPELFADPFLINYANNLATSSTDSALIRLRTLNPNLVDEIRARAFAPGTRFRRFGATGFTAADSLTATGNFADVLIFKSCNNGATYTASTTSCQSDRTVDVRGNVVGLGYQAYARLAADPVTGVFTKVYTDNNVTAGRTYLYSLVTRSRGFSRAVTLSRPGTTAGSVVQYDTVITVADTASGVIASSGPTTVRVYVPISRPAGAVASTINVTTRGGTSTLPVNVTVLESARAGEYRLLFGNQFTVTTRTTLATGEVSTTVVARRTSATARVNGQNVTNFVADSSVFTTSGRVDFAPATATTPLPVTSVTTTPQTRTESYTVNGLGFLALSGTRPLFVSQDLTGATATPAGFVSRSDFPGVVFSLNQVRADSLVFERIIQANGDTVENSIRDNNAVQFQQLTSTRRNGASGVTQFRFRDDAFGPNVRDFTLGTVPQTEAMVNTSLAARAVATTADVSANVLRKVRAITGFTTANLVARKFPFVVIGPAGDTAILAAVTRTAAQASIVIGNGADTARIVPPEDLWVPGDQFFILQRTLRDSVVGGVPVFADTTVNGQRTSRAVQVRDTIVTYGPAVLGCNTPRASCNPLRFGTLAATGYLPYQDGWRLVIDYPQPFTILSDISVAVTGMTPAQGKLTKTDLAKIRVVPNPYVVQSELDQVGAGRTGDPRILFTGVPQEGMLRIYSVSGQFLQQLRWTAADLNGTGDLAYNLRTREGTDLAAGLYIFTIEAMGENAGSPLARGKFVVIR